MSLKCKDLQVVNCTCASYSSKVMAAQQPMRKTLQLSGHGIYGISVQLPSLRAIGPCKVYAAIQ